MKNILITGATGNIGFEVIKFLFENNSSNKIIAGVRNVEKAKLFFNDFPSLELRRFDFEDAQTYESSFADIDRVFLLRPPHISDVKKYFKPILEQLKRNNISEIVFLSVQGVEKTSFIPHNKIERLIKLLGFNAIFLRPSYFMQNLTTTLLSDIKTKRAIILPAGKAKFNWVDVENIGELAALMLDHFSEFKNQNFEITGTQNASFQEVVDLINVQIENPIQFINRNPIHFYRCKQKEGINSGMILVMIMLHFLPRFQKKPTISNAYKELTGKPATTLELFIKRELNYFEL